MHIVIGTKLSYFFLTFVDCTLSIVLFIIYLTSGSIDTFDLIKVSHEQELLLFYYYFYYFLFFSSSTILRVEN